MDPLPPTGSRAVDMAAKRPPLASNPNAVNSPLRAATAAKRPRVPAEVRGSTHDFDQPPPKRRLIAEPGHKTFRPTQAIPALDREARVLEPKGEHAAVYSSFQRKLLATRDPRVKEQFKEPQRQQLQRHESRPKPRQDDKEARDTKRVDKKEIKTWRQHYFKLFPSFVFYFENLPQDAASRILKAITHLSAREEKFFSHHVTHIITTRPIPESLQSSDTNHTHSSSSRHGESRSQNNLARTIDPSLLNKYDDVRERAHQQKSRTTHDLLSQRRLQMPVMLNDSRRQNNSQSDFLIKARDMGKKIWSLEKFDRVLETLLRPDSDAVEEKPAKKAAQAMKPSPNEPDLTRLLQIEKQMPSDRPPWSDLIAFRNFYVYVHDVEEKTRPVMMREYKKREPDEDGNFSGEWPQLNAVPEPRCPFVAESVADGQEETEKDTKIPEEAPRARKASEASIVRAATAPPELKPYNAPPDAGLRKPPMQIDPPREPTKPSQPIPPHPRLIEPPTLQRFNTNQSNTTDSLPPQSRFQFASLQRVNLGREPLASGVQQSNQTSNIRSQMMSSTAPMPGARRGTTKEMHDLKKRAFEQRRGMTANANEIRAAINNPLSGHGREARPNRAPALHNIREDEEPQIDEKAEESSSKTRDGHKKAEEEKVKAKQKPGYCENCRDKYDNFREHIQERKHRAFATRAENWTDLDALLKQLARR